MITRIVKLTFREDEIENFKSYFDTVCETIRKQEGCNHLQAWQEINQPNIIFTYSLWNTEQDLDNYKKSEFFGIFWKTAKSKFKLPAEAWSFNKLLELD